MVSHTSGRGLTFVLVATLFALLNQAGALRTRQVVEAELAHLKSLSDLTWVPELTQVAEKDPEDLGLMPVDVYDEWQAEHPDAQSSEDDHIIEDEEEHANLRTISSNSTARGNAVRGYQTEDTPIKNQGNCGSCYAFGACAAYEDWYLKSTGVVLNLSEQDLLTLAKEIGPMGGCSGWYPNSAMQLLKSYGVTDESCCPYRGTETPCSSKCSRTRKIKSYAISSNINSIKSALANKGAVLAAYAVYSDFMYYSSGIYTHRSGSLQGYHAIAIVGYDDDLQCFKVKNSWGANWGENGYFRIAYSQMKNDVQFGTCFGGSYWVYS